MSTVIVHEDSVRILREEPPGRIVRDTVESVRILAVAKTGPPGIKGDKGDKGDAAPPGSVVWDSTNW